MNLLLLLPLAFSFVCLAVVSFLAFLSVVALAAALRVIGTVTAALGIAGRKDEDPWHGAGQRRSSARLRCGTGLEHRWPLDAGPSPSRGPSPLEPKIHRSFPPQKAH